MYARENAGQYTITGGRLSDFVPYHSSKFPGLPVERCLDAPRIAADGVQLICAAKLGIFCESRTIVG